MNVGEHQTLLTLPPPNQSTVSSDSMKSSRRALGSIRIRSPQRAVWKAVMIGGIGMMILATLFALYTSTTASSSPSLKFTSSITEQERSLLSHYYGPYLSMTLLETSSSVVQQLVQQLRNAQQTADTTIQELNDGSDNENDTNNEVRADMTHTPDTDVEEATASDPNHPSVRGRRHRLLFQNPREHPSHHNHHDKYHGGDESLVIPMPIGCETTVVLIRHCEKELIAEHCAYNGYERSVYLSTLFGDDTTAKYPKPRYIFAESPISRNTHSHKMNFREVETVGPMAEVLNVPIDDSYTDETIYDLARHLKERIKHGDFCGQVVVIVWKHTRIGELAHMLGCGPLQGCPIDYSGKSFDQLWQIRYVYTNEFTHSTHKHHFLHHPADNVYWKVFGSIQYENFDPLAFSKLRGDDYDSMEFRNDPTDDDEPKVEDSRHHNDHTAWQEDVVSYPERSYSTDTAGWKVSMLGLSKSSNDPATVP